MSIIQTSRYHHTQKGPWGLMCYGFAVAFVVASLSLPVLDLQITFLVTGLLMFLLGVSFHYLTVEDEGDHLVVRFGPFPLFRRRIPYDDIVEIETGRTTFLAGWGIHWSPWGGWVWNVWGYDYVLLRLKSGKLTIGTDDAEGLAGFVKSRISSGR
jgi:hypothetical protein